MPGERELTRDVDIDVAGLISEVWKKRWLVIALTVLTGVALVFALSTISPRYTSSARVLIEKRESVFTRRTEADQTLSGSQFDEQAIGSQVQVLSSDDIALKVIDSLNLADHAEFREAIQSSLLNDALIAFGLKSAPESGSQEAKLLEEFRKRLKVYAAAKSRVLVIEFWSHDPDLARDVPNAIANEYLAITKQAKLESNVEATDWLAPEIDELRGKVRDAEAKVAEFRSNSDILVGKNNSLLATQQLSETSSELSRLRSQGSAVEAKAQSIRTALANGGGFDSIPEVVASPLIQRLRERQVALQSEISELSTTLLPNHPRIKALRSQLADFDVQIKSAARDILQSLENNADVVSAQEVVLLKEVDRLKAEAARVGEAEVELRALEREAAAQRELLESYLTQYREAASRQTREYLPVDARIISRAIRPIEPYFPKVVPFSAAGAFTMLVLSVVGILSWALMTGRALKPVAVIEPEFIPERVEFADVVPARIEPGRRVDTVDYAANDPDALEPEVPPITPGDELAVPPSPANLDKPEIFDFGYAATAIGNLGRARIAIVSPAGDPGSVVARMLARGLAAGGSSVAMIDLTGSAVSSRQMLGEGRFAGLYELAAGTARFSEVVHSDRQSPVHVLPPGQANSDAEVEQGRLTAIAEAMSGSYDFLIVDCGYTGPQALKLVADEETVVIISCEGASEDDAIETARDFHSAGFPDTIMVRLGTSGRESMPAGAAA